MNRSLESTLLEGTAPSPVIARRKPLTAHVGVFGVGHHTYWPQFEGLLEEMHRKLAIFRQSAGSAMYRSRSLAWWMMPGTLIDFATS